MFNFTPFQIVGAFVGAFGGYELSNQKNASRLYTASFTFLGGFIGAMIGKSFDSPSVSATLTTRP